jgi:hypothetical protein
MDDIKGGTFLAERIALYRRRAAEAVERAKTADSHVIRTSCLNIARSFDHLADVIEDSLKSTSGRS